MYALAQILSSLLLFLTIALFCDAYELPEPTIEVLKPKGLRVSIPDEEGVQLFAFHGNVNKEMDGLEAGDMSKDILKKRNGRWVFEERKLRLKKGDTVYYWLFVIKDGLGYRLDDRAYVFDDVNKKSGSTNQGYHKIRRRAAFTGSDIQPSSSEGFARPQSYQTANARPQTYQTGYAGPQTYQSDQSQDYEYDDYYYDRYYDNSYYNYRNPPPPPPPPPPHRRRGFWRRNAGFRRHGPPPGGWGHRGPPPGRFHHHHHGPPPHPPPGRYRDGPPPPPPPPDGQNYPDFDEDRYDRRYPPPNDYGRYTTPKANYRNNDAGHQGETDKGDDASKNWGASENDESTRKSIIDPPIDVRIG